jgi:hypothetical protein
MPRGASQLHNRLRLSLRQTRASSLMIVHDPLVLEVEAGPHEIRRHFAMMG